MTQHVDSLATEPTVAAPSRRTRTLVGIALGALLVTASAQVAIPLPFTPVPITLQPLAVLIVGGLLGPSAGCAALVAYLAMGMAGLPVFAAGGSAERLIGPTGGYLLSYPVVAAVVGWLVRGAPSSALRVLLAMAVGMTLIHIGGASQLALLTGSAAGAVQHGIMPFLTGDLLKIGFAAVVILLAGPRVRSAL